MDLVRLAAMNLYWKEHPPAHIVAAWAYEIKKEPERNEDGVIEQDFSHMMALGPMIEGPLI